MLEYEPIEIDTVIDEYGLSLRGTMKLSTKKSLFYDNATFYVGRGIKEEFVARKVQGYAACCEKKASFQLRISEQSFDIMSSYLLQTSFSGFRFYNDSLYDYLPTETSFDDWAKYPEKYVPIHSHQFSFNMRDGIKYPIEFVKIVGNFGVLKQRTKSVN